MAYIIIFDTETTGIEKEDRIIQYGAIIVDEKGEPYKGDTKQAVFEGLCSTDLPIKLKAMSTHNIRQNELEGMPKFVNTDFYKVLQELNNENNFLIAHNLPFDLGMLEKEGFNNKFQLIDTLRCAKHMFKKSNIESEIIDPKNNFTSDNQLQTFRYKLFSKKDEEKEATKYGVTIHAHNAIGDVVILKLFLRKLRVMVANQFMNLSEVSDIINNAEATLHKLVELTNTNVDMSDEILTFGKHEGKSYRQIRVDDKGWLEWYLGQKEKEVQSGKYVDQDLMTTIKQLLNQ